MDLRPEASDPGSESESGPDRCCVDADAAAPPDAAAAAACTTYRKAPAAVLLTSSLPSSCASDATRCWSSFLPDTLSSVCLVLQYFCCSFFTTDEFWSGFSRSRSSWEEPLQTDSS